ncbi:MAG: AAA family ATPase [Oscillospiraceae bacterium]|nr:AAA family ATPase [Oscillospiraceae bacterium]
MEDTAFSRLYVREIRISHEIPEESYLRDLPVVRHLLSTEGLALTRRVTFFVGENGVGKSTLIEALAIAMGFNPEGGTINFRFSTNDSHSDLYRFLTVGKGIRRQQDGFFLRAESFYNLASDIDQLDQPPSFGRSVIDSYGGVSLHHQSHGESFLSLVENRFGGHGLYILDEPEAALSPMRLMSLICRIHELVEKDSQFIISTHSPILMAFPGAEIFELSEKGIQSVPYQQTEHFQITRQFLNAPEKMLDYLLK